MDVVWLVLDSLSFDATPFADDGLETMPELASLAEAHGIIFQQAYAPGPLSPSSHASFFTGKLPSKTGMHEANPFFDGTTETIAGMLSDTHHSSLISVNNFLFTGLEQDFDAHDDLTTSYMLFEDGDDPRQFAKQWSGNSRLRRYISFVLDSDTPLKSCANGLNYMLRTKLGGQQYLEDIPKKLGDDTENYQYALTINQRIRDSLTNQRDQFVVANYMDVHPPLAPSQDAIDAVVTNHRDQLPIGAATERVTDDSEKSFSVEAMDQLYRAAVWDLDRKVAPLIADLIADDIFVAVTADHGRTYSSTPYSEKRRHVPLILFHPDEDSRVITKTVDLRALPATTLDAIDLPHEDAGKSLFQASDDRVAVTEIIYNTMMLEDGGIMVDHEGKVDPETHHDIVLKQGEGAIELRDGVRTSTWGPDDIIQQLTEVGSDIHDEGLYVPGADQSGYDDVMQQRLEDLGYM